MYFRANAKPVPAFTGDLLSIPSSEWSLTNATLSSNTLVVTAIGEAKLNTAIDVTDYSTLSYSVVVYGHPTNFYFDIEISSDGVTWSQLKREVSPTNSSATRTGTINLSSYTGNKYFRCTATAGAGDATVSVLQLA